MLASQNNHVLVVEILLQHNVQVDMQSKVSLAPSAFHPVYAYDEIDTAERLHRTDACIVLRLCISGRYITEVQCASGIAGQGTSICISFIPGGSLNLEA